MTERCWKLFVFWMAFIAYSNASASEVQVWAVPEGYKIDKFGKKIFVIDTKQDLSGIRKNNEIWDSATSTVALALLLAHAAAFRVAD